jgi:hypothetical protein
MAAMKKAGRRARPRRAGTGAAALLCGALVSTALGGIDAASGERTEYQVKAAFLMNFTKFVEWPAAAFQDAGSPLTICILGEDPFGASLDQAVEGETAGGRKVAVQRIRRVPGPKTCQVLFITKSEKSVPETIETAGPGVLTVGESDRFLEDGGIIAFVLQARHVRFDINLRVALRASLVLSARLLNVARTVLR